MARQNQYPKVFGVRLSVADRQKLDHLCVYTRRPPGEVLRLLVRLAQPPPEVPQCTFSADLAPEAQIP